MNQKGIIKLLLTCSSDLKKLYDKIITELSRAVSVSANDASTDEFYNIERDCTQSEKTKVQTLLSQYSNALQGLIQQGITRAILLSAETQEKALKGYTSMDNEQVDAWRKDTAKAFITSRMKRDKGLNLSDRVWNYTQQTKSEFELAMSQAIEDGISKGTSAETLGRKVRQYLNQPDMMYRRYHTKKLMSDGTKKDVVEWRRRVVDENGKVHFVKEDLAKVGTGVYRSARQNALRLTITETNMAYNYSNCSRWADEPFVLGVRIRLSEAHPEDDICDTLEGDYPKTFMWRGWHPRCMCSISPILMDRSSEEWKKLRAMSDEDYKKYQSPNLIKNVPKDFKDWCDKNKDKLDAARERGKLPYFVRDNEKVVGEIVGWEEPKQGKQGKQGYLGRSAKNEAYEIYKNEKPTVISKEQEKNVLEIAKLMGIKMQKVKPMTFNEADNGQANVNYRKGEEYRTNCQTCVVVHEARLRGLDITAKGYIDKVGSTSYELGEHFEDAWVNPKTGKSPQPVIIRYGKDWLQKAEKQMKSNGRYHIGINYANGYGHVITAEQIDGSLIYYDPQSNTFENISDFDVEYLEILKVDKLLMKSKLLSKISKLI